MSRGGARAGDQALARAGKVWPLPGLAAAASLHVTLATVAWQAEPEVGTLHSQCYQALLAAQ